MRIDNNLLLFERAARACGALLAVGLAVGLAPAAFAQHAGHGAAGALVTPLPSLSMGAVAPALPAAAAATAQANQVVVYGGQAPADDGVSVAPWGGGNIVSTASQVYMPGGHSLQIVTKGPYQGGQITFATPVPLGNLPAEKNRYFQLVVQVTDAPGKGEFGGTDQDQDQDMGGPAVYVPRATGGARFQLAQTTFNFGGGMRQGGPPPGFRPPPGASPYQPQPQPGQQPEEENPGLPIKKLHLIFQLSDGSMADVMRPVPQTDTSGWIRVAVPLSVLPFPASSAADANLKSLIVAGDAPATIYVGEIRMLNDDTPITAIPPDDQDVAAGDEVTFSESADGGASSLRYTWDFDTKGGFVAQDEGQTVTHTYSKAGDYKVTLMVSDLDGIKKPAMVTCTVHVED